MRTFAARARATLKAGELVHLIAYGILIGLALGALATMGVAAGAMYAAYLDHDQYKGDSCIDA